MGVFGAVKGAKPSEGGSYFEPEHHWIVMVQACKHIETRKKENAFIVECKVLETTFDKCRPGAERSWYVDLKQDAAGSNLVHFGMVAGEALTGEAVQAEEVDEATIELYVSDEQPVAGQLLGVYTYNKPTRAGKPFTRHKWRVLDADELKKYEPIAVKLGLKKSPAKAAAGGK